jgi:hypothetical protein
LGGPVALCTDGIDRALDFVEAEQFADGAFGFAAGDLLDDVGTKVTFENKGVKAAESLLDGEGEIENVHAVAVVFDLLFKGLDLAGDDFQPAEGLTAGVWGHVNAT